MAIPTEALAMLLEASETVPTGVNVYSGPTDIIQVPAIVLRPDNPWIEPDRYCDDLQHYVAIAVVSASTPIDGTAKLYAIALGIIATIQSDGTPWEWVSTGAPVIDQSTGLAYLAAPTRLTYKHTEEEVS